MPYIEAKLSIKLDEKQKNELQSKLTDAVSYAFSKPKSYIMVNIEDDKSLYMAGDKPNKSAYIAVRFLGTAPKSACQVSTKNICDILNTGYGISQNVYVTYHPVELWGYNGSMF